MVILGLQLWSSDSHNRHIMMTIVVGILSVVNSVEFKVLIVIRKVR